MATLDQRALVAADASFQRRIASALVQFIIDSKQPGVDLTLTQRRQLLDATDYAQRMSQTISALIDVAAVASVTDGQISTRVSQVAQYFTHLSMGE